MGNKILLELKTLLIKYFKKFDDQTNLNNHIATFERENLNRTIAIAMPRLSNKRPSLASSFFIQKYCPVNGLLTEGHS